MSRPGLAESLARDVFNAMSASVAVLDGDGTIVAVNDAWIRFGIEHGATDERHYAGANYVTVCERAFAATGDGSIGEVVLSLRAILAGARQELSLEYPCECPAETHWFQMKIARLPPDSAAAAVVSHEEITERKRIDQALHEASRTLRATLEALPVGVWLMDATGRIVSGNPASLKIWTGARYVGPGEFGDYRGWWRSSGKPILPHEWAAARAIANGETSIDEEIEIECFDGTRKIILNSAIPLLDESRAIQGAIIVNQDITARVDAEMELQRAKEAIEATSMELSRALDRERTLARADELTGTVNRRHFFDLAAHAISVARRYDESLSLVLFDIDHFKSVNDTFGHQVGDDLLKAVVRAVRNHLREADVLARYGGDEFVVLLPHTRAIDAAVVAERMRADVSGLTVTTPRGDVRTGISSGISELLGRQDTLDHLIHRADLGLYQAKRAGRNRTAVTPRHGLPTIVGNGS